MTIRKIAHYSTRTPALPFIVLLAIWVLAPAASRAAEPCQEPADRACLEGMIDLYLDAMVTHDPSLLPLSPTVRFTENGRELALGEGLWETVTSVEMRRCFVDPDLGDASAQAVLKEGWRYVVFFVRLKIDTQLIEEVETVRVRRADNLIFAPRVLIEAEHPFWEESIPVAQRQTREELVETTNAYFVAMETEGTEDYQPAAFNEDCNRWENGMRTSNILYFPFSPADQFDLAFFKGNRVPIRRYPLVDVERGVVVSLVVFEADDRVPALVAEIFKIENSAISGIQAVYLGVDDVELPGWEGNYF